MKREEDLLSLRLPRKETCTFSGGGADHEPPIGTGEGSFFFNIPTVIKLADPTDTADGYKSYSIVKVTDPRVIYKAIFSVQVITEVDNDEASLSVDTYKMAESQNAKLRLWLAKEYPSSLPSAPHIIIDGNGGGIIKSKKEFTFRDVKKKRRKKRALYPDSDFRVVKWAIVDNGGNPIIVDGRPFADEGDDLYNFYINFHH